MPDPRLPFLHHIDAAPLTESLESLKQYRLELGTTRSELADEELEDARLDLIEAMKILDDPETRKHHVRLAKLIKEVDDFRAILAEDFRR